MTAGRTKGQSRSRNVVFILAKMKVFRRGVEVFSLFLPI
jgi:hypothetical protein